MLAARAPHTFTLERTRVSHAMIKVRVDASVFWPSGGTGQISGTLEFDCVPRAGDLIALGVRQVKVESVIHIPGESRGVLLMLEDLVFESAELKDSFSESVSTRLGLFFDDHSGSAL